ncbi:short-chain dehydrogenase [Pedobacter quisquiliarum]|uniref:Short-chain dehydrogenase n=1 Tax=Pedobacter quisquiliarum TaxID=1834438 RepID=A0A916U923_9SPHI|nr:SDR family oxidoreductase [Pedobacter quisquiliarum]GGC64340.1 short-chain dehydrogenase [Pedobacter quisquiliarum]
METNNKTALITGATKGIGYELAKLFAKDNYNIIMVARTPERHGSIEEEFAMLYPQGKFHYIEKDLSRDGAADELYEEVKALGLQIDVLVNNAGIGEAGPFIETDLKKNLEVVHTNVISLVSLTHYYLKEMVARNEGRILQLGSVASFSPNPLLSVYAASKAFVRSFTEAIINEIKDTKVTMTLLAPNATDTGFFINANAEDTVAGQGEKDSPADVAKAGYDALMKGENRLIYGLPAKAMVTMGNVLPDQAQAAMARKQFEEKKD